MPKQLAILRKIEAEIVRTEMRISEVLLRQSEFGPHAAADRATALIVGMLERTAALYWNLRQQLLDQTDRPLNRE